MLRVDELRCGACSTHADRDNDWTHGRSRSRTCTYGSEQDERSGPRRAEAFRRTTVPRAEDRRGRRDREPARSSSRRKNHWRLTRWARSMSPACSSVRSRVEVASAAGLRYTERSCVRRSHQPSLTLQLHVSFGWQAHCGSGGTADALASGASWSNPVGVQIPASAPSIQARSDGHRDDILRSLVASSISIPERFCSTLVRLLRARVCSSAIRGERNCRTQRAHGPDTGKSLPTVQPAAVPSAP